MTEIERVCDAGRCLSAIPLRDLSGRDLAYLYVAELYKSGNSIDSRDILGELDRRTNPDDFKKQIETLQNEIDELKDDCGYWKRIISEIEVAIKNANDHVLQEISDILRY